MKLIMTTYLRVRAVQISDKNKFIARIQRIRVAKKPGI